MAGAVRASLGMMSEQGTGGLGLCHMANHMQCSCLHVLLLLQKAPCSLALCSTLLLCTREMQLTVMLGARGPGFTRVCPRVCAGVSMPVCVQRQGSPPPPSLFSYQIRDMISPWGFEVPLSEAWALLHAARGTKKVRMGLEGSGEDQRPWMAIHPIRLSYLHFYIPSSSCHPALPLPPTHTLLLFSVSY